MDIDSLGEEDTKLNGSDRILQAAFLGCFLVALYLRNEKFVLCAEE